jgi:hypothetical protein
MHSVPCPVTRHRRPVRIQRIRATIFAAPVAMLLAGGCATTPADPSRGVPRPSAGLPGFRSQAELEAYHTGLVQSIRSKPPLGSAQVQPAYPEPPPPPGVAPTPKPARPPEPPRPRIYGPSLARAQGDYLLALRGGRLSSIRIAGGALEPVETVDALGPGADPDNVFFYGLEGSGDTVQVLAARTNPAGTDHHVASFRLDAGGRLEHVGDEILHSTPGLYEGAHAARRVGGRLALYDRMDVPLEVTDPSGLLPALRLPDGSLASTVDPRRVYRSVYPMSWPDNPKLHVLTSCLPADGGPACTTTALYAPEPTAVHVSPTAVYLRVEHPYAVDDEDDTDRTVLYRMPLDGSTPSAVQVSGSTFRSEAFMESADGHLNVHLMHDGWTEESRSQFPSPALLRLPLSAFGDGRRAPDPAHYRTLQRLGGPHFTRFVGEWLLYGNRPHDPYMTDAGLVPQTRQDWLGIGLLRWADTTAPSWLATRVPTRAFAPVGENAALALVGSGDSLALAYLRLADSVRVSAIVAPRIEHGEDGVMRGVVHRPDGADAGLLGIVSGVRPGPYEWRSTAATFIRYDATSLRQLGELALRGEPAGDRDVVPVFALGRIFALLGDEVAEAVEESAGLREVRRVRLP